MSIYTKFCFLIFLGHQFVRDRTAQAGTPILKFTSIYMKKMCTNMKCWAVLDWIGLFLFLILLGHQSVTDWTAQAGVPIFKCTSIYMKCTNMKCWEVWI